MATSMRTKYWTRQYRTHELTAEEKAEWNQGTVNQVVEQAQAFLESFGPEIIRKQIDGIRVKLATDPNRLAWDAATTEKILAGLEALLAQQAK